jgi:RNA polymerase sigma-70 factor, ECF subfamily
MEDQAGKEALLVVRAAAGDKEAFAGLVRAYQARLRGYVARHLYDQDDLHDLVQEALIEAWRSLPRFEPDRPLWPWWRAIAKNRIKMYFRARRRHRADHLVAVDEMVADLVDAEERDDECERIDALRGCLDQLQPRQRALVHARFYDNRAVQELAGEHDTSPASITMRLQRLRYALKRCLEQRLAQGAA